MECIESVAGRQNIKAETLGIAFVLYRYTNKRLVSKNVYAPLQNIRCRPFEETGLIITTEQIDELIGKIRLALDAVEPKLRAIQNG